MNLKEVGVGTLNKKIFLIIILFINSCSTIGFDNVLNMIKDPFVIEELSDEELVSSEEKLIIRINNNDEILALPSDENMWSSKDDMKFFFQDGKLTKTSGLKNNFRIINFKGFNINQEAYIEFENPKSGYLQIDFSYETMGRGELYLRTLKKDVSYQLIKEDFSVDIISWSGSNYYWIDMNGKVIMTKQQISPFGDKIRISK